MLAGLLVSAMMVFCVVALAFTARMDRYPGGASEFLEVVEVDVPLPLPELDVS